MRNLVGSNVAKSYPYSTIVYIESYFADGTSASGSGVVVGINDVLTASHVVFDNFGKLATEIIVYPGKNGFSEPYGSYSGSWWNGYTIYGGVSGLLRESESQYDFGIIGFDREIGSQTGWMGIGYNVNNGYFNLSGYPSGAKGISAPNLTNETNYASWSKFYDTWNTNSFSIEPGSSGGPLWYNEPNGPYVVGVVSTKSWAADISAPENFKMIVEWINGNNFLLDQKGKDAPDVVVHRFFNIDTGVHFYTPSEDEKDLIITTLPNFQYEGIAFVTSATENDGLNVFRFFNTNTGTHFYTADIAERDAITQNLPMFVYEGSSFFAYDEPMHDRQGVHRFYNTDKGMHFYTASDAERDAVVQDLPMFVYEGVSFYVDIA